MTRDDTVWRERGLRDAVLNGDERAWHLLYDESFGELEAYVHWRCRGLRDLAEEVIQDCWLTAVRSIGRFDPEKGTFLNWLRGVAANLLRNRLRRRGDLRRPESAGPTPSEAAEQREQAELVALALAELPDHYDAVLRAKYLEQRPVQEIAQIWNTSVKAIESLLSRAALAFREVYPVNDTVAEETP